MPVRSCRAERRFDRAESGVPLKLADDEMRGDLSAESSDSGQNGSAGVPSGGADEYAIDNRRIW